jgi:hypothetical protein
VDGGMAADHAGPADDQDLQDASSALRARSFGAGSLTRIVRID